jgi:DNA-binding transcriptional regulator YhcF (GntR family)
VSRPIDNGPHGPELDLSGLSIDRKDDVPIGVQLAWALRTRIAAGGVGAGQRLPGLRDLAEATGVNVNTVRAVYQRLEQDGLIDRQQGSGTFVAPAPPQTGDVGAITANAAHEAREVGIDPREVAAALYVSQDTPTAPADAAGDQSELLRRRSLRGQIAGLERALGEIEAEHPGVAPASERTRRGVGPALLTVQELTQVRGALIRRLTTVQGAIDEHLELLVAAQAPPATRADEAAATASDAPESAKRKRRPRATVRTLPAGT